MNRLLQNINRTEFEKISRLNKIRLDKNERNYNHSNSFIKFIKKKIDSNLISSYPEVFRVYKLISKKFKINTNQLLLTFGADHALKSCFESLYKKKTNVITLNPTFAMVDIYCKIYNVNQIKINYDENLNLNFNSLINSINQKCSLIIIANPNSPTGSIITEKQINEILLVAKKNNSILVLDEAYCEYAKINYIKKIFKFNNLVIVRTFSKAYGLAGLRLGYIISNKKIIKYLKAVKPMYEANSFALIAAEHQLNNFKNIKNHLNEIKKAKNYVEKYCKQNNFKFINTHTNFVHIDFQYSAKKIKNYLNKKNILVKIGLNIKKYENYLRISLSDVKTIKLVFQIIRKYLSGKKCPL